MKAFMSQNATTNPSLILQAAGIPECRLLIDHAIAEHNSSGLSGQALTDEVLDRILILFGLEILKIVPGLFSTEVDARLSFDTVGTVAKARSSSPITRRKAFPATAS
jgi:transaldolase